MPFSQVVQILYNEAPRRSKDIVDSASEEELNKMKEDLEKAEADAQAAQNQQQDKIDLPDDTPEETKG